MLLSGPKRVICSDLVRATLSGLLVLLMVNLRRHVLVESILYLLSLLRDEVELVLIGLLGCNGVTPIHSFLMNAVEI